MKLKYTAKNHGYWLDGKRCKSPSTIAKVPESTDALDRWRRRQTAIGLALHPHLLTAIAAAADNNQTLDQLCEEALTASGANSKRDWGTAVHRITELIDGGDFVLETPEVLEIRHRWRQLLANHNLEVVASEQVVVHPELKIAGRFDRVVRHTPTNRLYILDTKTGASAATYLHAHAVQLWLYASAPLRADGPSGDANFEIEQFTEMWPVQQDVALVAHVPADGVDSIIAVDINAGRDCFNQVITPTWAWRTRTDIAVPDWAQPATTPRAVELADRVQHLVSQHPDAAGQLRALWPTGCPPLRTGTHTTEQLDTVDQLVTRIEDQHNMPFNPPPSPPRAQTHVTTPSPPPDPEPTEGETPSDQQVLDVKNSYNELGEANRTWITGLFVEARDNRRSFHLLECKTMRALRIVRGLVSLAEADTTDTEVVLALVAKATDNPDVHTTHRPLGAVVGQMDHIQAAMFSAMATALAAGRLRLIANTPGQLEVVDPPLTTLDQVVAAIPATIV